MGENNLEVTILSEEILERGLSRNGGYSLEQLKLLGIYEFHKGWKKSIIGKPFKLEILNNFIALKDCHL